MPTDKPVDISMEAVERYVANCSVCWGGPRSGRDGSLCGRCKLFRALLAETERLQARVRDHDKALLRLKWLMGLLKEKHLYAHVGLVVDCDSFRDSEQVWTEMFDTILANLESR